MNKLNPILAFSNTQISDYYNFYIIGNLVLEEQKTVIYSSYSYEENDVYYCASATGLAKFGYMMAGAGIGAGIGAATAGLGTVISGALNVGGAAAGAIVGAATGLASGASTGLALGALGGQKGMDLWNSTWKGRLIGMGSGIVMGGIMGGIEAAVDGKSFWDGGPTLQDKLSMMVENNKTLLDSQFGESEIGGVHLANKKNLAALKNEHGIDYRQWNGNLINSEGVESNGFYVSGYKDVTADGYDCWFNNEIYVSKNSVRAMWKGKIGALGTLGHEWRHSHQLYTGEHARMLGIYNNNYIEFQVHQLTYYWYPTNSRLSIINYYGGLLGFPKIYR